MGQLQLASEKQANELMQQHIVQKRQLPKRLKDESKTRTQMFKQSLRLSGVPSSQDQDRQKLARVCTVYLYDKSYSGGGRGGVVCIACLVYLLIFERSIP